MAIKAKNMEKEYGPNKVAGEKFLAAEKGYIIEDDGSYTVTSADGLMNIDAAHPGVAYVKDVVQPGESAGFVQQGDALGTPAHITVHPVVPDVKVGAGGGIRALGVDHQLVRKTVLVQPGSGGQIVRPAFPVPGQAVCRALGKGEIFFGFAWHSVPPFVF